MCRLLSLIAVLAILVICGCQSGMSRVSDHQMYDTGELKSDGDSYYYASGIYPVIHKIDNMFSHSSDFYKDGRLKTEEWFQGSNQLLKLEFYGDGRLKSEERFDNGVIVFGMYFTGEGELERTVGQRLKK